MFKSVKYFLIITLFFSKSLVVFGQDFTNKGKDFWVGYGSHVSMYSATGSLVSSGGGQDMVLYFTSDHDANITVEIPGVNYKQTYKLIANTVITSDPIPKTGDQDARIAVEGKLKTGIHITADYPIIAYAHIYQGSISGASLLFPTNTLGQSYYSLNFKQVSNNNYSYSYAFVIATEDNTNIEIIPSVNTTVNKAGDTISVTLQKGEIYNVFGRLINASTGEDLTGTLIRSVATAANPCKKIAVFSGSGKITISDNKSNSADNLIQQSFPSSAWGKNYITVPTAKMPLNFYRIAVSDKLAKVKLNGTDINSKYPLINNFYYEFQSSESNLIESDLPINVAQYITTSGSYGNNNNGNGDPEMIYLSPLEQTINKVTINSTPNAKIVDSLHFINIVIPKEGVASLKVDNNALTNPQTNAYNNKYVYFQYPLKAGYHTIVSDSGFNAIAYGYGSVESYGYNAGANVKDLNQQLTVENKFATVKLPITCKGTVFTPSITLPYMPLSLKWIVPTYDTIVDLSPIADTSYISLSGKLIYKFTLKKAIKFDSLGTYNISLIANNPTADGCSGEQLLNFDLSVLGAPKVDNIITTTNCISDSIVMKDNTLLAADDRKIGIYKWSIVNELDTNTKSFTFLPKRAGKFTVNYFVINDVGCISDTISKDILIDSIPIVNFGSSTLKCQNIDIQFTDSSKAQGASVLKSLVWNFGDASKVDTIDISNKTIAHKFDSLKNYTVTLSVITENGCVAKQSQIIKNNPIPVVGFILPEICLADSNAQFKDTTKIADLSNQFKYKWDFGDAANAPNTNTDIVQNPKHRYTKVGDYSVSLEVTSLAGCASSRTMQFTVNGSYPTAIFQISNDTALCSNQEVELINKSTVDIGTIGKLIIFWDNDGDLSDTTVDENPSFNKSYKHLYKNFSFPSKMNFKIKMFAYTGGVCVKDTSSSITIVPPPTGMSIFSYKEYVCLYDTLSLNAAMQGGVPPYAFKWKTDNAAAAFTDNILKGVSPGTVNISMTATDKKQCNYDYNNIKPIEVSAIPIAILKAKDTVVCNQDPITLLGNGNFLFSWVLNGQTLYSSIVDTFSTALTGFYRLKVNDGKCNSLLSDSIFIKQLEIPNYTLNYNPTICINTPLQISTNAKDAKNIYFKWDFGDLQTYDKAQPQKHTYPLAGNYIIKLAATNDYCPKYQQFLHGDSIKVVLPVASSNFTLYVLSEIDTLFTPLKYDTGYNQFQWFPTTFLSNASIEHPIFNGNKSINYILTRTNSTTACKVDDLYKIDVSNDVVIAIPKAFTPNGDNLNDVLRIQYGAGLKTFNFLKIFNRWGNLVFMSTNVNQGWDGTFNGIPQEMDAYTYFMSYITFKNEPVSKTGSFILLR